METNSAADEGRCSERGEEEEEEEDVSLCDFPVNLMKEGNQQPSNYEDALQVNETAEEEFDFVSVGGGCLLTGSEMCAADDVFFQGQILPLRLSISSDNGLSNLGRHDSRAASRSISRSESMDHSSLGRFRSISNGSSSCCSGRSYQHSSSTSSSNNSAMNITRVISESRISNHFHSHPSPKPQIRVSSARLERISSRNQKSSLWDFFRMGLVRTPDIDLQEFKVVRSNSRANNRASVSRNSSVNSENGTGSGTKMDVNLNVKDQIKQKRQIFLISGCKCSIETVASNAIMMKNRNCSESKNSSSSFNVVNVNDSGKTHAMKELKMMKNKKQKQKQQQQQGKQALSHHRTYEWLKELSHANFPMYV